VHLSGRPLGPPFFLFSSDSVIGPEDVSLFFFFSLVSTLISLFGIVCTRYPPPVVSLTRWPQMGPPRPRPGRGDGLVWGLQCFLPLFRLKTVFALPPPTFCPAFHQSGVLGSHFFQFARVFSTRKRSLFFFRIPVLLAMLVFDRPPSPQRFLK